MAQGRFQVDQTVYLISSVNWIKEAKVLKCSGGFYTIKWTDSDGGTRVRESRLYASKEEAESARDSVKRNRAQNRDLSRHHTTANRRLLYEEHSICPQV